MLTPMQIRDKRFQSAGRNSYKSDDVDVFFDSVSESYEQMFKENAELIKRVSLLAERLDQYKKDEDSIKSAVITAQKAANKIELEAKERAGLLVKESEDILAAAKAEVDIIKKDTGDGIRAEMAQKLENAENEAGALIDTAKKEAADIILEAEDAAKNVQGAANRTVTSESILFDMLKKEVSDFKNDLLARYKTHIELISQLPELARQKAKEEQDAAPAEDEKEPDAQPLTDEKEGESLGFDGTEPEIEFIESKDEPPEGVLSLEEFINEGAKGYENEIQRVTVKEEEIVENAEIPFDKSADKLEFIKAQDDSSEALDVNDFISSFEEDEQKEEKETQEPKKRGFALNRSKLSKPAENDKEDEDAIFEAGGKNGIQLEGKDEEPVAETIFDSRITTGFKMKKPVFSTDTMPDNDDGAEITDDGEDAAADGSKNPFSDEKNENLKKRFSIIRMNDGAADTGNGDIDGGDYDNDEEDDDDENDPPSLRKLFKKKK